MSPARRRLLTCLGAAALLGVACGDGGSDDPFEVVSSTVSDPTTQDISLFAPDSGGSWPVVVAFHGIDGSAQQMAPLSERVAAAGAVVAAPDYRSDLTSEPGIIDLARDVECGYRYVRTIAADHGGDLDRPVVWVGWSLGAVIAVQGGLDEAIDPTGEIITCFSDVPRPDVIIAVSGCYEDVGTVFDPDEWGNPDAELTIVGATDDTVCPVEQSERVAQELTTRGYDADLVVLEDADHFAPVFHQEVDGELVVAPDEHAGDRVVEIVTDALARDPAAP